MCLDFRFLIYDYWKRKREKRICFEWIWIKLICMWIKSEWIRSRLQWKIVHFTLTKIEWIYLLLKNIKYWFCLFYVTEIHSLSYLVECYRISIASIKLYQKSHSTLNVRLANEKNRRFQRVERFTIKYTHY